MSTVRSPHPELDLDAPPRSREALQLLVQHVVATGDAAEKHYLEAKSWLDLRGRAGPAVIAKFILGAANRDIAVAAQAFRGFAVLIIGVEKGKVTGVPPIDDAELGDKLRTYLGSTGPQWETARIPVPGSSNEVLAVLAAPPLAGHRPYVCQATGDKVTSGAIYIRRSAQTAAADAGEVDQLLDRWTAHSHPDLDVEVRVAGALRRYQVDDKQTLEPYLARERKALLSKLPQPKPPQPKPPQPELRREHAWPDLLSAWSGRDVASFEPSKLSPEALGLGERRTKRDYREQIDRWEQRFRESWQPAVRALIAYVCEPNTITVANRNNAFLEDVEVALTLPNPIARIASRKGESLRRGSTHQLGLPQRPHDWGEDTFMTRPPSAGWRLTEDRDTHILVRLDQLRPRYSVAQEHPEVFLVDDEATREQQVRWALSAQGRHETLDGELVLPVSPVEDLTDVMRFLLHLDE